MDRENRILKGESMNIIYLCVINPPCRRDESLVVVNEISENEMFFLTPLLL